VLTISSYRVPNIKFNVAKVLQSLIPIVDQSVSNSHLIYITFLSQ
jgi:serine/threonine-protein phosphatase 2A regulatory subunit A